MVEGWVGYGYCEVIYLSNLAIMVTLSRHNNITWLGGWQYGWGGGYNFDCETKQFLSLIN